MQKITITVKDDNKLSFFMELINQFDFIEIQPSKKRKAEVYNFFDSAGLWKDRSITVTNFDNKLGRGTISTS